MTEKLNFDSNYYELLQEFFKIGVKAGEIPEGEYYVDTDNLLAIGVLGLLGCISFEDEDN